MTDEIQLGFTQQQEIRDCFPHIFTKTWFLMLAMATVLPVRGFISVCIIAVYIPQMQVQRMH